MDDDRIERLLSGYRVPDVSPKLDQRVLRDGTAIMARARLRIQLGEIGRDVLHGLGFGYLPWLFDFVTKTDAEYSVEFI
jgi:hypothetical protein